MTLAISPPQPKAARPARVEPSLGTTRDPGRLLVVEDDLDYRDLIATALRAAGVPMSVEWVESGFAALSRLRAQRGELSLPRVVILDHRLPGIRGLDVLRAIKHDSHPDIRRVPVAMLTSSARPEDCELAYHEGALSFMTKPHTFEALVRHLDRV